MAVVYENSKYKEIASTLNKQLVGGDVAVPIFIGIGDHASAVSLRKRLQSVLVEILTHSPFNESVVSQRAHDVIMTSYQRRCDVMT